MAVKKATPRKDFVDAKFKADPSKTRAQWAAIWDEENARKTTSVGNVADLLAKVERYFPAYAYLLKNESVFGGDVAQALADAVKGSWEATRFEGALQATKYFTNTGTAAKSFDAKNPTDQQSEIDTSKQFVYANFGASGLDDATVTGLAKTIARRGLNAVGAKQFVFQSIFTADAGGTLSRKASLESGDGALLRQLAKGYNYKVTDAELQGILSGQPDRFGVVSTKESLVAKMKAQAVGANPHLKAQIDAGSTLEDITSTYRSYAAKILEQDEDQVDMFSGPMLDAWSSTGTDGKSRQLGLGEWMAKLKSDARFGYQYTKQANKDALDLGTTIARAFGKVQ